MCSLQTNGNCSECRASTIFRSRSDRAQSLGNPRRAEQPWYLSSRRRKSSCRETRQPPRAFPFQRRPRRPCMPSSNPARRSSERTSKPETDRRSLPSRSQAVPRRRKNERQRRGKRQIERPASSRVFGLVGDSWLSFNFFGVSAPVRDEDSVGTECLIEYSASARLESLPMPAAILILGPAGSLREQGGGVDGMFG